LFNLTNVLLLIWFIPWLIVLAKRTVRSKGESDEVFRLEYINTLVRMPELSILEVHKEVAKFGNLCNRMSGFTKDLFLSTDPKEQKVLYKRIRKYETITNQVELELSAYLTKISGDELSPKISRRVRNILSICSDLESVGDLYLQISKNIRKKAEDKIWFNQSQRFQVTKMFDLVEQAHEVMLKNLSGKNYDSISSNAADQLEKQINKLRKKIQAEDFSDSEIDEQFNSSSQIVFTILINQLEKVGNIIHNVTDVIAQKERTV